MTGERVELTELGLCVRDREQLLEAFRTPIQEVAFQFPSCFYRFGRPTLVSLCQFGDVEDRRCMLNLAERGADSPTFRSLDVRRAAAEQVDLVPAAMDAKEPLMLAEQDTERATIRYKARDLGLQKRGLLADINAQVYPEAGCRLSDRACQATSGYDVGVKILVGARSHARRLAYSRGACQVASPPGLALSVRETEYPHLG